MQLEHRVKALEQELKILKNQIQKTLLDIQEQVLIHYYPSLRQSDGAPPTDPRAQRPRPSSSHAFQGAQQIATQGDGNGNGNHASTTVQQVTLKDIRRQQSAPDFSQMLQNESADSFTQLATWAETAVANVGVARTRKLVEMNVGDHGPTKQTLLQLLSFYNESEAPERGGMQEMASLIADLRRLTGDEAG